MKRSHYTTIALFSFLWVSTIANCKLLAQDDPLLNILKLELKREMDELKKAPIPPYYIDYYVSDIQFSALSASFGSLTNANADKSRVLAARVKVGDYELDNTHPVLSRGSSLRSLRGGFGSGILPLENDTLSLQFALWKTTDKEYREALETYKTVKNEVERTKTPQAPVADFSKEAPGSYQAPALPDFSGLFDKTIWENKIKRFSAIFLRNTDIVDGDVSMRVTAERRYFVSTEGAQIIQNFISSYLLVRGSIRTEDGDIIPLHISYYGPTPAQFPSDEKIAGDIEQLVATLEKLKRAPLAEPYTGPAILMAPAAGVFFHEIFGHRIEGHRLKNETDGQTFMARINDQVLPKTLHVYFDPTLTEYKGHLLNGHYLYDDEGTKSQRVNVVEKGILKTFLMSRSPLENFPKSNGHGRASAGSEPVSRQSNLIVDATKTVSMDDLRKMLVKECQKQGKEYGYLFKQVIGGFTMTGRSIPNAFNIFPTEVYRVYVNGKPDELVRGVDLIGTPLAMFAEIQTAANDEGVFIGFCGAESGQVPVSASSPSLFVRRIETQKKPRQHEESTLLARPSSNEQ